MTGDAIEVNRRRWDQMATLHQQTYFVDPDRPTDEDLSAFEKDEIGSIAGQRICHLQCHLGGESLALARMGATVVGVDFSAVAVEHAAERASAAGLADQVTFVCASVDDAPAATDGVFDGVYTSWGVLCWLPDIGAWARSIAALLAPGGWLYLAETHPHAMTLRWPEYRYGGSEAIFDDQQGDYTDADAIFEHPESWQWNWSLGEIVTALADAGLHVEWLHEHTVVRWHLGKPDTLTQVDGMWTDPESTLPLSFSLRAVQLAGDGAVRPQD